VRSHVRPRGRFFFLEPSVRANDLHVQRCPEAFPGSHRDNIDRQRESDRVLNAVTMAVLVTNDFPPHHGGIQRCMYRLAQELSVRGEAVTVVAPKLSGSADFDRRQNFRVLRYPGTGRLAGFITMFFYLLRARLAAPASYTVASMWFPGGLAACLIPKFLRGRLGILAHGAEVAPARGGLRRHVMRYVFARADVIMANSRFTQGLLERAGVRNAVSVIHLGIDGISVRAARAAAPTILSVGRLVARKGFDTVIAAMPAILRKFPSARYEIVGDGPFRAALEAQARELGVQENVTFHGAVDDEQMAQAYARAWCFALPVRAVGDDVEGFGLVYLEAALAGIPALGGLNSGAEDAIASGETGLLVDGTSTEDVCQALLSLIEDPARAAALGARGRERALREFTWPLTARNVEAVMSDRTPVKS
jgi:phosphatidylinositol alpha-1,6-mannosyltransferase